MNMRRIPIIISAWLLLFLMAPLSAQEGTGGRAYQFRFVMGDDMFYTPWGGNAETLAQLEECVAVNLELILSGEVPVRVDGWCGSAGSEAANLAMAKIRSNRVKSELILRKRLTEECFITRNHSGGGDYVTVQIVIPADKDEEAGLAAGRAEQERIAAEQAGRQQLEQQKQERIAREKEQARIAEEQARQAAEQAGADSLAAARRITDAPVAEPTRPGGYAVRRSAWYVGIQGGMPFGASAMSSFGADSTTPGWSTGIYGGCRFNPVLSLELQASWSRLTMNGRDCCPDYWMGADGNRYEAAVAGMDGWYMSDLQSNTFVQRYAVQLNVNLLGFFTHTKNSSWSLDLSPHIAAVGTKSGFRLTDGRTGVLQGGARWHFGAGGNVQASYTFPAGLQLGVYTGMTWLTGKPIDGTPEHLHKANHIWESGLRLGWSFSANGKEDGR